MSSRNTSTSTAVDLSQFVVADEGWAFVEGSPQYAIELRQQNISPALFQKQELILHQTRKAGLNPTFAFNAPLFTGHRVVPGANGRDWVFMRLAEDPLFTQKDKFPLPDAISSLLLKYVLASIEFDDYYICHEVKAGLVKPGGMATLEMLKPPPTKSAMAQAERYGQIANRSMQVGVAPLAGAAIISTASLALAFAGVALAGTVAPALGQLALIDPIIWGVIKEPNQSLAPGTMASFFSMCAWAYGE